MTKYSVTSKFRGYNNREDITNMSPGHLVVGSQNVILNEADRLQVRLGYTLDGQSSSVIGGIASSYDWITHLNTEKHLRAYNDGTDIQLEYRYVDSLGVVTWRTLTSALTNATMQFAPFWDTTEQTDILLFVDGTANIYQWSGGVTTFASATVNTITKQGTTTWAQEGFLTTGTRQVVIDGITYTYTGGESTLTLTGVTPDPTAGGHTAGDVIHQAIRTTANSSFTNGPPVGFVNDLIAILYNRVYLGCLKSREVFGSQANSFTVYTFSSPRTPGEGCKFTLDTTPTSFITLEDLGEDFNGLYISGGTSEWYKTVLELSADQAREALYIRKLKAGISQGAISQNYTVKIKNEVFFITNEPAMVSLGQIENINTDQNENLSNPIENDFNQLNFAGGTGGSLGYWRNKVYLSVPADGMAFIFDLSTGFWQPPQILPVGRWAIIDDHLYIHSATTAETYKMFNGRNDNGNPINAVANLSYENYGDRVNIKEMTEYYAEGYISSNTTLVMTLFNDFNGCNGSQSFSIQGTDTQIICDVTGDGSLGKQSFGKRSLAGRGDTTDETVPPKFRVIQTFPMQHFRELQVQFSSNSEDQNWQLLAYGPGAQMSTSLNQDITK